MCMWAILPIFLRTDRQAYCDIHREIFAADIGYGYMQYYILRMLL